MTPYAKVIVELKFSPFLTNSAHQSLSASAVALRAVAPHAIASQSPTAKAQQFPSSRSCSFAIASLCPTGCLRQAVSLRSAVVPTAKAQPPKPISFLHPVRVVRAVRGSIRQSPSAKAHPPKPNRIPLPIRVIRVHSWFHSPKPISFLILLHSSLFLHPFPPKPKNRLTCYE